MTGNREATAFLAALAILTGVPLLALLAAGLGGWGEALSWQGLPSAVRNTALVALVAAAFAVIIGGVAALLVARGGLARPVLWRIALAAPMLVPQSALAVAWVMLADERGGLLNVLAARAGFAPHVDVHTLSGMALVTAGAVFPPCFLLLEATFARCDPALEEAAALCGASASLTLRRIVVPLAAPALAAAALLAALAAAAALGPQAVLGLPAGHWTLANLLYTRWNLYTSSPASLAALAAVLLALGGAGAAALSRLDADSALSGPRRASTWPLGRAGRAAAWCLLATFAGLSLLPLAALLLRSMSPYGLQADDLSGAAAAVRALDLSAYATVWADPAWRRAFAHSFILAAAAALGAAGLGFGVAAFVVRPGRAGARAADLAATWPLAASATAWAVAAVAAFGGPPLRLLGTLWLPLAVYLARELPLGYRAARAALAGVPREMEEAAALSGAGPRAVARVALWPAAAPAVAAAAAAAFAAAFRELEASVLLASPGAELFGAQLFGAWQAGTWREMAAAAVLGAVTAGLGALGVRALVSKTL